MPLQSIITGGTGKNVSADVVNDKNINGLVTFSQPLKVFTPGTSLLLNSQNGTSMKVNGTSHGTSEYIYSSTNNEKNTWKIQESNSWNHSNSNNKDKDKDTKEPISITKGKNGDQILFSKISDNNLSITNYTVLSGKIMLENVNTNNNHLIVQLMLDKNNVGHKIDIFNFIDAGLFNTYQNFQIVMENFKVENNFNGINITVLKNGTPKPSLSIDDLKLEEAGGGVIYTAYPRSTHVFKPNELIFNIAANTFKPELAYDKLLGLSLSSGIIIQAHINNEVLFSYNMKQMSDFIYHGFVIKNLICDGINTCITLGLEWNCDFLIDPRNVTDHVSVTINDDLTALLEIRAKLNGTEEKIKNILIG